MQGKKIFPSEISPLCCRWNVTQENYPALKSFWLYTSNSGINEQKKLKIETANFMYLWLKTIKAT